MTTPKAKLAGLALIAAMCAGFTLGLTAPAWAGFDEGVAAYHRGDYATALPGLCAAIVGNRGKPSGESRSNPKAQIKDCIPANLALYIGL